MAKQEHYDDLETRDPAAREAQVFTAIAEQVAHAKTECAAYAQRLAQIDPASITSPQALAGVPLTRKAELMDLQAANPPFGGLTATPISKLARVFASPGPIYEPQGHQADFWRMARALFAAGVRPGDLVYNTFSYHLTPAGAMLEGGARALGCPVVPAGTGQTELQVRTICDLKPAVYVGTPSFLKIILDKARELSIKIPSIKTALVSGEALPETLRSGFADLGIHVSQCYATADLGLIAYESAAREGLIADEGAHIEIVTPGTGDPVAPGEVGEVVVTVLNSDYPLIRFATGDLSAVLPGVSPCGRTNTRIKGWLGRADQTTKIKGMFVHPEQVAEIVARHPEISRARLLVSNPDNLDHMLLQCELSGTQPGDFETAVADSIREVTKLGGDVQTVCIGTLPNDGKVIDDQRDYT